MSWPSDNLTNTYLDQTTDNASLARAELNSLVLKVKSILAEASPGDVLITNNNLGTYNIMRTNVLNSVSNLIAISRSNATMLALNNTGTGSISSLVFQRSGTTKWKLVHTSTEGLQIATATTTKIEIPNNAGYLNLLNGDIQYNGVSLLNTVSVQRVGPLQLSTSIAETAHSAGYPTFWNAEAQCVTANGGWVVGERVHVSSWSGDHDSGGGGDSDYYGGSFWVTGSVCGCRSAGTYKIRGRDGSIVTINNSNWRIYFNLITVT